jgi:hypothetical protein
MISSCLRFVAASHLQQFKVVLTCKEWLEKYNLNRLAEHMKRERPM